MTYSSLPLAFMHPSSLVMHPPTPMALMGLSMFPETGSEIPAPSASQLYFLTQASMPVDVSMERQPAAARLSMQSGFSSAGHIRYRLRDEAGALVLDNEDWLPTGAGEHGIEMSSLNPGLYSLLVTWNDDAEEPSGVMYRIEKLQ